MNPSVSRPWPASLNERAHGRLALGMVTPRRTPGSTVAVVLSASALVALVIQLAFGTPIDIIMLVVCSVGATLVAFVAAGPYSLGAWVAMFYGLGNVLVALYAKTLLGQQLDSYLEVPQYSFLAIAVTSGSLLAALLVITPIPVGRPVFRRVADSKFLSFLSWTTLTLGTAFWFVNRSFQDPTGSGFGGVALFRDLLIMAVIARTAMLLEQTGLRRSFDIRLGVMFAVCVALGVIDNQKAVAALPIVSHVATVFFYRKTIPMRTAVITVAGWVVFAIVLAPLIHGLRALGQQELTVSERIELVSSTATRVLQAPQEFEELKSMGAAQFEDGYYNYFGGNGAGQMLLGRYASVQQIDPVIAAVNKRGPQGGDALWPGITRLAPGFLYPDKPEFIAAYTTLVYYGLVDPAGGKYPSLPLAGQAFAAYGLVGLMIIPFLTFAAFLLLAKKWGWELERNVYAIFFLCDFVIVYISQGDFGQYAGAVLRNFPLFALTFLGVQGLFAISTRLARRAEIMPAWQRAR